MDEAHNYKNLFLYTKMRNVAGLSTTDAQKSSDMFAKCRYMDELTGGRGVVFATGTPVSNSMTELYTMQRYLLLSLIHISIWQIMHERKIPLPGWPANIAAGTAQSCCSPVPEAP